MPKVRKRKKGGREKRETERENGRLDDSQLHTQIWAGVIEW